MQLTTHRSPTDPEPTVYIEKIGDVLLVERSGKTWIAYCTKYKVWKFDLGNAAVLPGRRNKSTSGRNWPERIESEIGKKYWDNLTILDIEFRSKGVTSIESEAWALCHDDKYNVDGWLCLKQIRSGNSTSCRLCVARHPEELILDDDIKERLKDSTISRGSARYIVNGESVYYYSLTVNGKKERLHRFIWFLVHGKFPDYNPADGEIIDHINRNTADNRLVNLRCVTLSSGTNSANRRVSVKTSKFKGVCFVKSRNTWKTAIKVDKVTVWREYFGDELSAAYAYAEKADYYNSIGKYFDGHWEALEAAGHPRPIAP